MNSSIISTVKQRKAKPVLAEADVKAAIKLSSLWSEHQKKTGENQELACAQMGMTQPNFSAYLNQRMPIRERALGKICAYFKCEPSDIREELLPVAISEELSKTRNILREIIDLARTTKSLDDLNSLLAKSESLLSAEPVRASSFAASAAH